MRTKTTSTHRRRRIGILAATLMAGVGVGFMGGAPPASALPRAWECAALAEAIRASQHGGELSGNPVYIEQYEQFCTGFE